VCFASNTSEQSLGLDECESNLDYDDLAKDLGGYQFWLNHELDMFDLNLLLPNGSGSDAPVLNLEVDWLELNFEFGLGGLGLNDLGRDGPVVGWRVTQPAVNCKTELELSDLKNFELDEPELDEY
jgi:hypothetical protein